MNTTDSSTEFDVRDIPCRIKHGQIIQRWLDLSVGAHFVLVNDHEPVPLYYQFEATFPGEFTWERLEAAEDCFKIRITRIAPAKSKQVEIASPCGGHHDHEEAVLDVRGMEPPGPMMEILKAVETLPAGGTLRARTDRRPLNLYPELDTRRVTSVSESLTDGSWLTTLSRA